MAHPQPPFDEQNLQRHLDWVRRLAFAMLRDAHAADDVAQDTAVAALKSNIHFHESTRRWLAATARNFVRQALRMDSRRSGRERATAKPEVVSAGTEALLRAEAHRTVLDAVLALDEPCRSTVLLRFFDRLPPREIARRQGIPVATVHTRLARAFEKLKISLRHDGRGNPREWALVLAPLFTIPVGGVAPPAAAMILSTLMKLKYAWLLSIPILAAVILYFLIPGDDRATRDPGRPVDAIARPAVDAMAKTGATPSPAVANREAVGVPEPTKERPGSAPQSAGKKDTVGTLVRGRVIDCDSRAVAGVTVVLGAVDTRSESTVQSDDDGIFQFENVVNSGDIRVRSERYTTVYSGSVPSGDSRSEPILIVAPKIHYSGKVVDGDGRSIEGADLELALPADFRGRFQIVLDFSKPIPRATRSGAQGEFEFGDAPELRGLELTARHSRYAPLREPAPATASWNILLTMRGLESGADIVLGRVFDRDGMPAASAHVSDGNDVSKADKNGYFTIAGHGRQTMTLTAASRGLLPATKKLQRAPSGWPQNVVLQLGGPSLSIAGRVEDADGKPVTRGKV